MSPRGVRGTSRPGRARHSWPPSAQGTAIWPTRQEYIQARSHLKRSDSLHHLPCNSPRQAIGFKKETIGGCKLGGLLQLRNTNKEVAIVRFDPDRP
jgi:hypothetical protein